MSGTPDPHQPSPRQPSAHQPSPLVPPTAAWAVEADGRRYDATGAPQDQPPHQPLAAQPPTARAAQGEPRRWSGRRTAAVLGAALALTTAGGVTAAALTPDGISAGSGESRMGPGGGFGGPGGGQGFGRHRFGQQGQQGQQGQGFVPGQQGQARGTTH